MNKWTLKSLAGVMAGMLAVASQANAAVTYSYVTDQAVYNAAPGGTVNVKLYLLETLDGGSTSVIAADGGLFGFGVRVNRTSGDATQTAYAGNDADFPTFPNPKPPITSPDFRFSQGVSPSAATGPNPGNGGANSLASAVYLGTVTITAGATNSQFNVLPYSAGGGNTLTNNSFYDLDFTRAPAPAFIGASTKNPATSFLVQIPEPTFVGIAGILGAAGTLIRRRRKA